MHTPTATDRLMLTQTEREYDEYRAKAAVVVDEVIVGSTVYGLFKMRTNRYWYLILTSAGGSARLGRSEAWARRHFADWVAG